MAAAAKAAERVMHSRRAARVAAFCTLRLLCMCKGMPAWANRVLTRNDVHSLPETETSIDTMQNFPVSLLSLVHRESPSLLGAPCASVPSTLRGKKPSKSHQARGGLTKGGGGCLYITT